MRLQRTFTSTPTQRRQFELDQPEYQKLAAERVTTPAKATAKPEAKAPTKGDITSYPDLPLAEGTKENSVADDRLWSEFLPTLANLGLSAVQVESVGKAVRKLEKIAEDLRAEAAEENAQAVREATEKWLEKTYGPSWSAETARANGWLRRQLPNGVSKTLAALRLEGGEFLGDRREFLALAIAASR